MLKKLTKTALLGALLSTTIFADDQVAMKKVCTDIDKTVETVLKDAYNDLQKPESIRVTTNVCSDIMKRYGVGMNITTTNTSGIKKEYGVNEYCVNMNSYIKHTYERYKETKDLDILYKFMAFTTRTNPKTIQAYKDAKDFEKELVNSSTGQSALLASGVVNIAYFYSINKRQYISYMIAEDIFQYGYQGVESRIGFNDPKFHEWLTYVITKDTISADEILDNYGVGSIKTFAYIDCKNRLKEINK